MDSNNLLKLLAGLFIFALILIIIVFFLYFYKFSDWNHLLSKSKEDWGVFGDFVGGTLNQLLSFLGLIALLLTLAISESSHKETKELLDEQHKTQIKQQFENTFFALLEQHNRILERLLKEPPALKDIPIYYDKHDDEVNLVEETSLEKNYIEALIEKLTYISKPTANERFVTINFRAELHHPESINMFGKRIPKDNELNDLYCANLIIKERQLCGYYFRFLYQLLKFIATNIPSEISTFNEISKGKQPPLLPNEKMYSNIVRSLLPNEVTLLLAINCYCQDEHDDFWEYKLLIERYAFRSESVV
jgi:hypothetical protein